MGFFDPPWARYPADDPRSIQEYWNWNTTQWCYIGPNVRDYQLAVLNAQLQAREVAARQRDVAEKAKARAEEAARIKQQKLAEYEELIEPFRENLDEAKDVIRQLDHVVKAALIDIPGGDAKKVPLNGEVRLLLTRLRGLLPDLSTLKPPDYHEAQKLFDQYERIHSEICKVYLEVLGHLDITEQTYLSVLETNLYALLQKAIAKVEKIPALTSDLEALTENFISLRPRDTISHWEFLKNLSHWCDQYRELESFLGSSYYDESNKFGRKDKAVSFYEQLHVLVATFLDNLSTFPRSRQLKMINLLEKVGIKTNEAITFNDFCKHPLATSIVWANRVNLSKKIAAAGKEIVDGAIFVGVVGSFYVPVVSAIVGIPGSYYLGYRPLFTPTFESGAGHESAHTLVVTEIDGHCVFLNDSLEPLSPDTSSVVISEKKIRFVSNVDSTLLYRQQAVQPAPDLTRHYEIPNSPEGRYLQLNDSGFGKFGSNDYQTISCINPDDSIGQTIRFGPRN